MSARVLVAYATKYGSTTGVAKAIAATLRSEGASVELRPADEVTSLVRYDAVVLGAPIYVGRWHKNAHRFLRQHKTALQAIPYALFALGPLESTPKDIAAANEQLDKDLEPYAWLAPVARGMFAGKYDPMTLNFFDRLISLVPDGPLHELPPSDNRDWEAINNWAWQLQEPFNIAPITTPESTEA